jgi:hypothetical protein
MKALKKYQPVLALKPTQFSVGLMEIEYKVAKLHALSAKKRRRLIARTKVPLVISPWGELCVIDRNNYLFTCWHAGITQVRIKVVKDYSHSQLGYVAFWNLMARHHYAYLYDQFGQGPRSPLYLPDDIRGLADDPYRSLAWMVRKEGGFANSDATFCEFRWADLFRRYKLLDRHGRQGFHRALPKAMKIARSQAARDLPGFLGKPRRATGRFVAPQAASGPLATLPRIA